MTNREAIERIQNDLKLHHDDLSGQYRKALRLAISVLEKQEQDSWTPCSEDLPKIAGEYLVTYHPCYWGEVRPELKVGFDSFRGKTTWAKNKYQKVVAWKEKPEPYKG